MDRDSIKPHQSLNDQGLKRPRLGRSRLLGIGILLALSLLATNAIAASVVTQLQAEFRGGKTYVTWNESGGDNNRYNIYRSTSKITSVIGMEPIATIDTGSGYDSRYERYHVIKDLADPLSPGTGLFVYTPKVDADIYYAVTVLENNQEDVSIANGQNSLASPVGESYWQWPAGVLIEHVSGYSDAYRYFYWWDYFDWPHSYDYYGEHFRVGVHQTQKATIAAGGKLPLIVNLHGYSGSPDYYLPPSKISTDGLTLTLRDNGIVNPKIRHSWWYGVSNNHGVHDFQVGDKIVDYTSQRVVAYIQALKSDLRFNIDPERVHLEGYSMGGGGTLMVGMHYPEFFASLEPGVARVTYPESLFKYLFGEKSLGLEAGNGIDIYKWANLSWVAENDPSVNFPPIINLHASQDSLHEMYTHSHFYQTLFRSKHGIWGKWLDIPHQSADFGNHIPGTRNRFLRNELYPAFSNSTADDNFGSVSSWDQYSIPRQPANFSSDAEGMVNTYIDWSSKLHDVFAETTADSLLDGANEIQITLTSSRANTRVDITPRRIQNFQVRAGVTYKWFNIDFASGTQIDSGTITPDDNLLLTVPQFLVTSTGNTLILESEKPTMVKNPLAVINLLFPLLLDD